MLDSIVFHTNCSIVGHRYDAEMVSAIWGAIKKILVLFVSDHGDGMLSSRNCRLPARYDSQAGISVRKFGLCGIENI